MNFVIIEIMRGGRSVKEYTILIRQGSGTPYSLGTYLDIISAKRAVSNLVDLEEERSRMYFVDNDFFYNKYCYAGNGLKYMCIQEREVTEWKKYSEWDSLENKDNIVYFKDYLKKP